MIKKTKMWSILTLLFATALFSASAWAVQLYANKLSGAASITHGTYGQIVLGADVKATEYTSQANIQGGTGSVTDIIKKINNKTDIQSHTFSAWVKPSMPTDGNLKTVYVAQSYAGDHGGYKVAVDSSGNIYVGKINWANGACNWNEENTFVKTSESAIDNNWHYLTVAITKSSTAQTATAAVWVDGVSKGMTSGTFATNLNGSNCTNIYIGAGVSVAGVYIDNAVLTGAATYEKANNSNYVQFAGAKAQIGEKEYLTLVAALADAQAGQTVTLLAPNVETVTIKADVTVDTSGNDFTGAVSGQGTLKVDSFARINNSTTQNSLKADGWRGAVLLYGCSAIETGAVNNSAYTTLNNYGNVNSKICFDSCTGSGTQNYFGRSNGATDIVQPEIVVTGTLYIGNGYSHSNNKDSDKVNYTIFRKLSGSGTISCARATQLFYVLDGSAFAGAISTSTKKFVFGNRAEGSADDTISNGAVIIRDQVNAFNAAVINNSSVSSWTIAENATINVATKPADGAEIASATSLTAEHPETIKVAVNGVVDDTITVEKVDNTLKAKISAPTVATVWGAGFDTIQGAIDYILPYVDDNLNELLKDISLALPLTAQVPDGYELIYGTLEDEESPRYYLQKITSAATYIVISPSSYVENWQAYVDARKTSSVVPQGMTFAVKNADEIYAAYPVNAANKNGDPRNDAESIHKYIGMMQKLGTQYFVLGGNWKGIDYSYNSAQDRATYIPGVIAYPDTTFASHPILGQRATDLYYACHYKADGQAYVWDPSGDGVYIGLMEAKPDQMDRRHLTPSCVVSRMEFSTSAKTYQECLTSYIAKLASGEAAGFSGSDRYVSWTAQCLGFADDGKPDVYGVMKNRIDSIDASRGAKELLHLIYLSKEPTLEDPYPEALMSSDILAENKHSLFSQNWELFLPFGHGIPGSFAGLNSDDFESMTGLTKFMMCNIPCMTGNMAAVGNTPSTVLANPTGGALVTINNSSYGYLTPTAITGRYQGLSDELADYCLDTYVDGSDAGTAWKTAIATYVGKLFTEGGINEAAARERALYTPESEIKPDETAAQVKKEDESYIYAGIIEQMLFGDPLVKIQVPKNQNKITTTVKRAARDHYFSDALVAEAKTEYAKTDASAMTVVDAAATAVALEVAANKTLTVESDKTLTNTSNDGIVVKTDASIGGSGTINSKITFEAGSTIVVPSTTAWLKIAEGKTLTVAGAINFVLPAGTTVGDTVETGICVLEKTGLTDDEFAAMSVGTVTIPVATRALKLAGSTPTYTLARDGNKVMLLTEAEVSDTCTVKVPLQNGLTLPRTLVINEETGETLAVKRVVENGVSYDVIEGIAKGTVLNLPFTLGTGYEIVGNDLTVTLTVNESMTLSTDLPKIAVAKVGEEKFATFAEAYTKFGTTANATLTVLRLVTYTGSVEVPGGKTILLANAGELTATAVTVSSNGTFGGSGRLNANLTLADGAWFDASAASKMIINASATVILQGEKPRFILPAGTTMLPGANNLVVFRQEGCQVTDGINIIWKTKDSNEEKEGDYDAIHVVSGTVYVKDYQGLIEFDQNYPDRGAVIETAYADYGEGFSQVKPLLGNFSILRGSHALLTVAPDANHKGDPVVIEIPAVNDPSEMTAKIPTFELRDPTTIYWNTTDTTATGNMKDQVVLGDAAKTRTWIIPGDTLVIGAEGHQKPTGMLTFHSNLVYTEKVIVKSDLTVTGGDAGLMLNNVAFEIDDTATVTIKPTVCDFAFGANSVTGGTIVMTADANAASKVVKAVAMDATSTLIKIFDPIELKSSATDGKTPLYVKGTFEGNGTFGSSMVAIGDLTFVLVPEAQGVDKNYLKFRGGVSVEKEDGSFWALAFDATKLSDSIQKQGDTYPTIPLFEVVYPDNAETAIVPGTNITYKQYIDSQVANAAYIARLIQPEIVEGDTRVLWQLESLENKLVMKPIIKNTEGEFFQTGVLTQDETFLFTKDFVQNVTQIKVDAEKTISFVFADATAGSAEQIEVRLPITLNHTLTIDVPANKTVYLNGAVSGAGGIVKTGEGKVVFTQPNSYEGTLEVREGTVATTTANGLGKNGNTITAAAGTTIDFANVGTSAAYNVTTAGTLTNTKANTESGNRGQIKTLTLTGNTTISGASFGMASESTIKLNGNKISIEMNPSTCGGDAETIKHNIFALNSTTVNRAESGDRSGLNDNVKDPDVTVVSGSIGSFGTTANDLLQVAVKLEAEGAICIDAADFQIHRLWTIDANKRIVATCDDSSHNHEYKKVFDTENATGYLVFKYEIYGGISASRLRISGSNSADDFDYCDYTGASLSNPKIQRVVLNEGEFVEFDTLDVGPNMKCQAFCLDWDATTGVRRMFYNAIGNLTEFGVASTITPWGVVFDGDTPTSLITGDWFSLGWTVEKDAGEQHDENGDVIYNTNPLVNSDWAYAVPMYNRSEQSFRFTIHAAISTFDGAAIYNSDGELNEKVLLATNGLLNATSRRPDKRLDFVVDKNWLRTYGQSHGLDMDNYEAGHYTVSNWLDTMGANGVERWQSYMLGLDPNDPHSMPVLEVRTDVAPSVRKNGKDYVNVCVGATNVYGFQFIAPVYAIEEVEKGADGNMQVVAGTLTPWQNSTNFQVEVPTKGATSKAATSGDDVKDHVKYFRVRVSFQGNDAFTN